MEQDSLLRWSLLTLPGIHFDRVDFLNLLGSANYEEEFRRREGSAAIPGKGEPAKRPEPEPTSAATAAGAATVPSATNPPSAAELHEPRPQHGRTRWLRPMSLTAQREQLSCIHLSPSLFDFQAYFKYSNNIFPVFPKVFSNIKVLY